MAKSSRHFVKTQKKKAYLTKKDLKMLMWIVIAVVIAAALYFIISFITDDSISIKDGKLVDVGDNWIVSNAGNNNDPKYYKYAEYDLTGYDGEVVAGHTSYDELATSVELYPADARYEMAYIYSVENKPDEVIGNVTAQIGHFLTEGEVHAAEEFEDGYIYWYTTRVDEETEDGETSTYYNQVFSGYIPADNDGTLIIRVTYRFDDAAEYVEPEVGYDEVRSILEHFSFE